MTNTQHQRLLTIQEVAELTGISVSRAKFFRQNGHPLFSDKAVRVSGTRGGKLAWKQSDVTEWINNLPYAPAGDNEE